MSSPWPLTVALTRPPPAVPVTSASASACWAFMSCSCICCAAANSCCISIWGSTSPSYAEPMTSPAWLSRSGALGSAFEFADHPAAQLTLDEVHAGQFGVLDRPVVRRRLVLEALARPHVVRLVVGRGELRPREFRWRGLRRRGDGIAPHRGRPGRGRGSGSGPPGLGVAGHALDRHVQAEVVAQHAL